MQSSTVGWPSKRSGLLKDCIVSNFELDRHREREIDYTISQILRQLYTVEAMNLLRTDTGYVVSDLS